MKQNAHLSTECFYPLTLSKMRLRWEKHSTAKLYVFLSWKYGFFFMKTWIWFEKRHCLAILQQHPYFFQIWNFFLEIHFFFSKKPALLFKKRVMKEILLFEILSRAHLNLGVKNFRYSEIVHLAFLALIQTTWWTSVLISAVSNEFLWIRSVQNWKFQHWSALLRESALNQRFPALIFLAMKHWFFRTKQRWFTLNQHWY